MYTKIARARILVSNVDIGEIHTVHISRRAKTRRISKRAGIFAMSVVFSISSSSGCEQENTPGMNSTISKAEFDYLLLEGKIKRSIALAFDFGGTYYCLMTTLVVACRIFCL